MADKNLDGLEAKLDKLIGLLQRAKLENNSLRKKNVLLSKENVALLEQKKKAAESVNSLIVELKDELLCQMQKRV